MKYGLRTCRMCYKNLTIERVDSPTLNYYCAYCSSYEVSLYHSTLVKRLERFIYEKIYVVNAYYSNNELDYYELVVYANIKSINKIYSRDKINELDIHFTPHDPGKLLEKLKVLNLFA
jgi:hypothetical protein